MPRDRREASAARSARAGASRQDHSKKLIFLIYFMKNMPGRPRPAVLPHIRSTAA
jgi:hypothetical protein